MKNAKVQLDGAALKVLPALVSGTTAVALGCREAHWNVKGPNFGPLHELFGDLYDFFNDWADTLAERVVQQGGVASALEGWQGGGPIIGDEQALLSQVSAMSNVMAEMIHESIPLMGNDETSKDALTEYGRDLEKWVWKLESHLQQFQRVEDGPEQFSAVVTARSILVKSASGHVYGFDENRRLTTRNKDKSEAEEAERWLQENMDEILGTDETQ